MKLFVYDHCPYCVKARMIFGLKNIPFELIFLLNDDEKTPISMINQKMLPILKTPSGQFMPESLDIIQHVDQNFPPPLLIEEEDKSLMEILDSVKTSYHSLVMPRWPECGMEEFKTTSAKRYFTNKKEKMIGDFSVALEKTPIFKKKIENTLSLIVNTWNPIGPWYFGQKISWTDFHLFSFLRALSVVKGLTFPDNIQKYMNYCSEKSKVPLNTTQAL